VKNKNKTKGGFLFFLLIPLILAGFFGSAENILAEENKVVINEVQIAGLTTDDDFIELYNPTCSDLDISGWKLRKRTQSGSESSIRVFGSGKIIKARGYFLWASSNKKYNETVFADETSQAILSNNYSIALFDDEGSLLDSLSWGTSLANPFEKSYFFSANPPASNSLERKDDNTFALQNSPSPKNSESYKDNCPKPKPKAYSDKIILNELLPAPSSGKEEYIELFNPTVEDINISEYVLRDASKTGKYVFPNGTEIKSLDYLVVYKKDFKFALNNSGAESVTLFDPNEKIISAVSYSGSKTDVSYNFDGADWHWSRFLTPGEENEFNNLPEISKKKDNKIYVGMYADFSANGHDKDKDKLKFTWDFGDKHKSYLKKTRHKYEKAGKYKVTLKVSDGSEDKIETFNVKVEKFPKSKVKILSVSPNPLGKDSDNEYIVLQNKSKKKINLKDWSVATGSKNLYNHPVRKDIVIKPGKTLKLTREYSLFALNNKKAKVELRYPNGKVASKLAYDKKKKSVAEDEIYTKESGQWAWIAPKTKLAVDTTTPSDTLITALAEAEPEKQTLANEDEKIILVSSKNFSEDESLKKTALEKFAKPQGIVLGIATFKPAVSGIYFPQPKASYLETIFTTINSAVNYFLNKFFLNLTL